MKTLNSLSNHVSGLPTKAVQTSTHTFRSVVSGLRKRDTTSIHSKSLLGYPLSLSTSGSNPDSSFAPRVNDTQSPLCLEFKHVLVSNKVGTKRVYNFQRLFSKNEFGPNPNRKADSGQNQTNHHFDSNLKSIRVYDITVQSKKSDEQDRNAGPYKIAFGTKGFIHSAIIAGETQ